MLGIEDHLIWLAYLACLGAAALSVVYGLVRRNRASDTVSSEDRRWAREEKKVEDEL
ncbi:MAG: hypothetical protein FD187_927 [bacterium]|nr:MAG: hypothetical protein FD142_58 [bacterium]KAF0149633.1 MAG: hypothetical protein FD187_927 [bacterium]KAF0169299.1 MAG: hypothetical protein FD158_489 [bacterium]TXT16348.1 MAG: hypothetical protein FD132_2869 [bacterium]